MNHGKKHCCLEVVFCVLLGVVAVLSLANVGCKSVPQKRGCNCPKVCQCCVACSAQGGIGDCKCKTCNCCSGCPGGEAR